MSDYNIKWRLTRFFCEFTEFAEDKAARIVPLVDKYVDLGTWAAVEDPISDDLHAAAIWTWFTQAELAEWLSTGDRPGHQDKGTYLGFLRFAARPGYAIKFSKYLKSQFTVPGHSIRYRNGQLIRRGVFKNARF